jgi:hypothetical protein
MPPSNSRRQRQQHQQLQQQQWQQQQQRQPQQQTFQTPKTVVDRQQPKGKKPSQSTGVGNNEDTDYVVVQRTTQTK